MRKLFYLVLGVILTGSFMSCDDEDTQYSPKIVISSTIVIDSAHVNSLDVDDLVTQNELEEWVSYDLSNAILNDFCQKHSYTYELSGSDLDELYQQADEQYKAEHLEQDLADAKEFATQMQTLLEAKDFTGAKVEVFLSFKASRILGEATVAVEDINDVIVVKE